MTEEIKTEYDVAIWPIDHSARYIKIRMINAVAVPYWKIHTIDSHSNLV